MTEPVRRIPWQHGRAWSPRDYALLILAVGLALWAARQELLSIIQIGMRDSEQSHVLLVPFVAGWLLWLRRERLAFLRHRPSLLGPAVIVLAWVTIWFGHESDTIVLQHVGALLLVFGAVLSATGPLVIRQYMPVLLVFLFFIPVPGVVRQQITIPLQFIAASITHEVLGILGVAAEKTGTVIIVQGQQVAVGEACNGMRMVFALTLVVYALVFSVPLRRNTKLFLLAVSPVLALFCNVIRLIPTAFVYGYGSPSVAEQFHDAAGWIMLPIALGLLILMLRFLRWLDLPVSRWRLSL